MSKITLIGNDFLEITKFSQDVRLKFFPKHPDESLKQAFTVTIINENLHALVVLLQEAERLFGLEPKLPKEAQNGNS